MIFSYNLLLLSSNAVELIQDKSILCSELSEIQSLAELHYNILFYLIIMLFAFGWILFAVGWILVSIARTYSSLESPVSHKNVSHGTLIELIWTITPALILMFIAFPSFKLLYLMDEVSDPSMAVLAEGHQWYWSYQYPDFLNNDDELIEDFLNNYNELIDTHPNFTMKISEIVNDQNVDPWQSTRGARDSALKKLLLQRDNPNPYSSSWSIYSMQHSPESRLNEKEIEVLADIVRSNPNDSFMIHSKFFYKIIEVKTGTAVRPMLKFLDFVKEKGSGL